MPKPLVRAPLVLDTGTYLSATLYPRSIPGQALERAVLTGRLLFSTNTLAELTEVMGRPKFDRWLSLRNRVEALDKILRVAAIVTVDYEVSLCRDTKDDKFLSLALAANASYIVTGDLDLLVLDPFHQTRILTPRAYLDL